MTDRIDKRSSILRRGACSRCRYLDVLGEDGHVRPLESILHEALDLAVRNTDSIAEAARQLKIGRSTLYRKLGSRAAGSALQPPREAAAARH